MVIAIVALTALDLAHHISWLYFDQSYHELGWKFDLAGDATVPSWYSAVSLFFASALVWRVGTLTRRNGAAYRRHWFGLSAILAFLSVDEVAGLHEWSAELLDSWELTGLFYYSWVVFGIAAVVLVGAVYLPFVIQLPARIRNGFLLAGGLFVGGALVVEMVNARYEYLNGATTMGYQLLTALEEVAEMAGVLVLVMTLFRVLHVLDEEPAATAEVGARRLPRHPESRPRVATLSTRSPRERR
jgi:hypothetical protein